jgi:hypothetical protein
LFYSFETLQLKEVVILEPQWLMNVMSTVVSTKHNYCRYGAVISHAPLYTHSWHSSTRLNVRTMCRNGVMAHSALPHIWKAPDFPPEVHPFILSLMERFELSFPVGAHIHKLGGYASSLRPSAGSGAESPTSADEALYLIPSLLPEARPAQLTDHWPPHTCTYSRC